MHVHLILFAAFFGALAYAAGAATGRKSLAVTIGGGGAVLGYIANGIIPQVEGLEWVQNLSPFHWLNGDNPPSADWDMLESDCRPTDRSPRRTRPGAP